ncbi:peroxisomal sarcosine oxidase-like [Mercenaria mercenaria]|uniref:peroxisomal sarcosine oxidase-like n=1 Tax=Mercenaria mercenaria TaxID=6596 RepID=UPI00234F73D4|nr:peroxisomal sarcosine oxidase-like [Mercenaria mercenaria]
MEGERNIYDVIVVGAGIEGSATAYSLAKDGKRTLLLEQFTLPHNRGSSHGKSRITRRNYGARTIYANMMKEAFELTAQLETECREQLFVNCEYLEYGPKGGSLVTESKQCLTDYHVPHETFDVKEQRKRYPHIELPDNYEFVLEKTGGILRADKMLSAFQSEFVRYGGTIRDGEAMLDLFPGDTVSVKTTRSVHKAQSVVLTLGAWAAKFLPRLGIKVKLQPEEIKVYYWKHKDNSSRFDHKTYPAFFTKTAAGKYTIYGLPEDEYPGLVKICLHEGSSTDPDKRDGTKNDWVLETMKLIIATHFPTLEKEPTIAETCIYTNTPDKHFILDVHPVWKNIVLGAGFSGHGFKLSPVVGNLLAQLATGQRPSYDMSPFRIHRFFKNKL